MSVRSAFGAARRYRPVASVSRADVELAAQFGDPAGEYRSAHEAAALFDRSDRALLIATGRDRRRWLHNLVTNVVESLADFAGAYAFACNPQGRILFDANILALPEALWLDIDAAARLLAMEHLQRYIIMDDVSLTDAAATYARCGVAGPLAERIAERLGVARLSGLTALAGVRLQPPAGAALPEGGGLLVRHDFAGGAAFAAGAGPGFELIVPRAAAGAWWDQLAEWGAAPAGLSVLDALRIEAGIPWFGRELDDSVLPPETALAPDATVPPRGVSYTKGCYVGQEVIERMRAHDVVARRLVRVRVDSGTGVVLPAALHQGARAAGRLTSLAPHPAAGSWIGLALLRTSISTTEPITVGAPPQALEILPSDSGAQSAGRPAAGRGASI